MIITVLFRGLRKTIFEIQFPAIAIFHTNPYKTFISGNSQMNQSLFLILNGTYALNGIIQGISKQSTDIHNIHKIQKTSICHHSQLDIVLLTVKTFPCQNGIQKLISGFILGFIGFNFTLHFIQVYQRIL